MFLSGCATLYNPATGRKEFIFINSATESAIGREVLPEMTKKYPLSKDARLQERAQRIGMKLAAHSDRKDIAYTFGVIEDKSLNAVTLPGGYVYVNRGLMEAFSDDELAYVMGHEIGHVAARHIAKKMQANMAYQSLLAVAFAALGNKSEKAQGALTGASAVYGLMELSYSRGDEFEADRLGTKYAHRAGYPPQAAFSALEKLKKGEGPNIRVMQYLRTHPFVDDRIRALREYIPTLGV